jgi:hypothetical protein
VKFLANILERAAQLWHLSDSLQIMEFELNCANSQSVEALRQELAELRTFLADVKRHITSEAGQTHKRLTAAIQSAANATLYEAQLVRRLECGTCHKQYGARVRWTEHGTLICPECAIAKGLD